MFLHPYMIRAVFFDWSGTLSNDLDEVLFSLKTRLLNPTLLRKMFFHPLIQPLRYFLSKYGVRIPDFLIEHNTKPPSPVSLVLDVKATLIFLKKNKIFTAIISTQSTRTISKLAKQNNILQYFDLIEGGILHKAALISTLVKKLHLRKDEVIYLSDLSEDLNEAEQAGVTICAVTWGYDSIEQLKQSSPQLTITALKELKKLITRTNKKDSEKYGKINYY